MEAWLDNGRAEGMTTCYFPPLPCTCPSGCSFSVAGAYHTCDLTQPHLHRSSRGQTNHLKQTIWHFLGKASSATTLNTRDSRQGSQGTMWLRPHLHQRPSMCTSHPIINGGESWKHIERTERSYSPANLSLSPITGPHTSKALCISCQSCDCE